MERTITMTLTETNGVLSLAVSVRPSISFENRFETNIEWTARRMLNVSGLIATVDDGSQLDLPPSE